MAVYCKRLWLAEKREIQELEKLYNSKQAELAAIYGHRRVGKYLINQVFSNRFIFKHAGLASKKKPPVKETAKQLNQFYLSLTSFCLEESENPKPKDWFEAFFLLRKLITKKR